MPPSAAEIVAHLGKYLVKQYYELAKRYIIVLESSRLCIVSKASCWEIIADLISYFNYETISYAKDLFGITVSRFLTAR